MMKHWNCQIRGNPQNGSLRWNVNNNRRRLLLT